MKYFIATAFGLAMSFSAYADHGQRQAPHKPVGQKPIDQKQSQDKRSVEMDQQRIDLITQDRKGKIDAPEYIVVKIDQDTGAKSVYYPNKTLVDGADVSNENFEAVTEFDGTENMVESTTDSRFTSALDQWHYRWYHNRHRGHSLRIGFNPFHPWSSHWRRSYGPVYRYGDYYDRAYRFRYNHYRPYYYYSRGSGLYFSVRLQP
ncbi:MAG: hypothetical protein A4S09_16875 [Proteobacteria bacterium SG_bin7]|nr:MAG: hypothetical protein A4S09_16875 [Proteobacteria bacterium SG_bin7]